MMGRLAWVLFSLAVTLCCADEAEDVEGPAVAEPALQVRILDERSRQVDGKTIVRNEGNDLRLNCSVNQTTVPLPSAQPTIVWYIPSPVSKTDRLRKRPGPGYMELWVTDLQMDDSGNFSCEVHLSNEVIVIRSFRLHLRSQNCGDNQFQCPNGNCIAQIYVCDGMNDCADAKDEELETCGEPVVCGAPRPGSGERFQCGRRCRPYNYCCYQGNCSSGRYINEDEHCCKRYIELTMSQYRPYEPDKAHYDRTYLETAIYTIIGCAVAFILIVSIMIVAFCRVHLRQSARLSSYSHMRAARTASHPPLADFDHLLMPGGGHFPAYYNGGPGHMMVTYNINNGVQVMPLMSPPSYSEAVQGAGGPPAEAARSSAAAAGAAAAAAGPAAPAPAAAPPAGPPPPYASRESLNEPPAEYGTENNNGDINGNSVASAEAAPATGGRG